MSEWKSGKVGVGTSAGVTPGAGWLGSDKEGSRRSSQRQGLVEAETLSCSQRAQGLVHPPRPTEECVLVWARQGGHGCPPTI